MYNVYNKSNVFYLWHIPVQKEYLIGDEEDFINAIAKNFRFNYNSWWSNDRKWLNPYLDSFGCNLNETYKEFQFFDGYNRCINPKDYEERAFKLFLEKYLDNSKPYNWRKFQKNTGIFRYDPVPHTGKWRGGPSVRPRKIKHLKAMYSNPEYKGFNRGSRKEVPEGWWDDWYRCRQRNWKSQSKRRHQWK